MAMIIELMSALRSAGCRIGVTAAPTAATDSTTRTGRRRLMTCGRRASTRGPRTGRRSPKTTSATTTTTKGTASVVPLGRFWGHQVCSWICDNSACRTPRASPAAAAMPTDDSLATSSAARPGTTSSPTLAGLRSVIGLARMRNNADTAVPMAQLNAASRSGDQRARDKATSSSTPALVASPRSDRR